MKHLLLIQPHSDDITFSAYQMACRKDCKVTILTIENNPKRIAEDQKFCDMLGINLEHLTVEYEDNSYYGFFKQYKEVDDENCVDWCVKHYGLEASNQIIDQLQKYIMDFKEANPDHEIIGPLGAGHPAHRFMHLIIQDHCDMFYRDFPHSFKRRGIKQLEKLEAAGYERVLGDETKEFDLHDAKYEALKKCYKSQSSLLFYENRFIERRMQETYYKLKKD